MPFLSRLPGLKIFLVNADVFSALRKESYNPGGGADARPQAGPERPAAAPLRLRRRSAPPPGIQLSFAGLNRSFVSFLYKYFIQ